MILMYICNTIICRQKFFFADFDSKHFTGIKFCVLSWVGSNLMIFIVILPPQTNICGFGGNCRNFRRWYLQKLVTLRYIIDDLSVKAKRVIVYCRTLNICSHMYAHFIHTLRNKRYYLQDTEQISDVVKVCVQIMRALDSYIIHTWMCIKYLPWQWIFYTFGGMLYIH